MIPAGTGQTELQLRAIADLRPTAYAGTPSFLMILLERGRADGIDTVLAEEGAGLAARPSRGARRRGCASEFGIDAYQCYGTADLGLIAYETPAREGLVVDEGGDRRDRAPRHRRSGARRARSARCVVTAFNPDYPLIRFATGDLSAVLPGQSPCGRTNRRIRGWLGRADQTTKVRGMFVHPRQIAEVAAPPSRDRPRAARGRARRAARRDDACTARSRRRPPGSRPRSRRDLRALTGLRGEIELVAPGSLANDGKVIDDRR